MKLLILAATLPLLSSAALAQCTRYVIDPTHTFVMYEMGHYMTTTNRGRFSTKDGVVYIDRVAKTGKIDITMDITTVNTGVDLLNRHVQSKEFFNVAEFPTGRFVGDEIVFDGDKISQASGILTLVGKAQRVTLKANRFNCYMSPMLKRQVCGGDFETTVPRSEWGLTWGLNFGFEDSVRLLIQVEGVDVPSPTTQSSASCGTATAGSPEPGATAVRASGGQGN